MRIKNLNNSAFSLLEILLAAVIFIISVGGVFATLNAIRTPVTQKEDALAAALFGKQVLEILRAQVFDPQAGGSFNYYYTCKVGAGTAVSPCQDFGLSVGLHNVPPANFPAGLTWSASLSAANGGTLNYTVTCADGSPGVPGNCGANTDIAHRVDLNLLWT